MNLLHIDASVLGDHSVSRQVSAAVVERLLSADPGLNVTYRDLAGQPISHLSGLHLAAAQGVPVPAEVQQDLAAGQAALDEFLAADVVVIGAPMYNFTLPSQLKAWIDRILVVGQTFRYGADGRPVGLAGDKRVILALARGGFYGPGSPTAAFEHGESYLRTAFGFIGVTNIEVVIAEGLAVGPEHRAAALAGAGEQILALAA